MNGPKNRDNSTDHSLNRPSGASLCFLGLGGNLGEPQALFDEVIRTLEHHPNCAEVRESSRYSSEPIDATGPYYVNSVVKLMWTGTPPQLIDWCMNCEANLGRTRSTLNAPRLIDIDVLLFGEHVIDTPRLVVPHPRMHLRRFVLEPLFELDPYVNIPGRGKVAELVQQTLDQCVSRI